MTLERLVEIEGPFETDEPQRLPHLLTTQFSAPEFAWLYRGWEDFMWRNRGHMASLYPWLRHWRRNQQSQEARLGHSLLSRREAAQRLHRSERTLKRLLELERLESPPVPAGDPTAPQRHWHLIEAGSVEQVQQSLEVELSLQQAAAVCGLSESSVLMLVKARILPALRGPGMDGAPMWAFHEPSIRDALNHLAVHLPVDPGRATPNYDVLTLSQALRMVSATALSLLDVLQAIQTGHLPSFRASDTMTLTTLRFERTHLETWVVHHRHHDQNQLVTVEGVCHMLHCGALTLQRWYTTKLLIPCQESMAGEKRRWWYRREDVEAFAERYITAKEAASLVGCSELTIQSWARAGTIPAASGPGIDGCHSYRFEKSGLIAWREERMNYQEVQQWLGRSRATLHRWIHEGKLKPLLECKGKSRWFARSAVLQLPQERSVT